MNRSSLCGVLAIIALVHSPIVQADTGFKVVTAAGSFSVPRQFVPISVWETMRIPTAYSNYFVFRIPAAYAVERIPGFRLTENAVTQDVIVAVEILTEGAKPSLRPGKTCWRGTHDGVSASQPYERCLFVAVSDGRWAVKYSLNGQNAAREFPVAPLINQLLTARRSEASEGTRRGAARP